MTIRAFGPVSSTVGIAVCRVRTTMSIGFSKNVAFGLIVATSGRLSGAGVRSLTALSVMSANGVAFRCEGVAWGDEGGSEGLGVAIWVVSIGSFSVFSGSGEADGFGVGRGGASDILGASDTRLFLFARTLCLPAGARFRGDAFFVGEGGGSDAGGLNM
jgi:hypothetical protein